MPSSYLIGEHSEQGINSCPGRPLEEVAAELFMLAINIEPIRAYPQRLCELTPQSEIDLQQIQCPPPAPLRARPPVNSTSGNASRNNNPTTRNTSLQASSEACRPTWSLSSCRA